ncbi:MAG: hypothetical protein Terrestrivirus5_98 [Terrestrivirus sp.]|uniref:Uncharacterized protein n=1 Tax=Terrestrivirus sp. TaxID=2487775 RepID=A0A3G4ZN44_9VIRU|nr:MAG: hypothetical protein Terrestrivirus5_98 [Terrestrivirus sp.]
MSFLKSFSYFEHYNGQLSAYLGVFPSAETLPSTKIINPGDKLFDGNEAKIATDLEQFLFFLVSYQFGFMDIIGCLLRQEPDANGKVNPNQPFGNRQLRSIDIAKELLSLEVSAVILEEHHQKLAIRSTLNPKFSLTLYARENTAPQEATDVGVYFVPRKQEYVSTSASSLDELITDGHIEIFTTLGNKRKTPKLSIQTMNGQQIDVFTLGLYGATYGAGEHLEAHERKVFKDLFAENKEVLQKGHVMKVDTMGVVKTVTRSLVEEHGFNPDDIKVERYIIGVHDKDGRDSRYWAHDYEETLFGYNRKSTTYLVVCFVGLDGKHIEITNPSDAFECDAAKIVELNHLIKEFQLNGQYPPAFPSHIEQLQMVRRALPQIIQKEWTSI